MKKTWKILSVSLLMAGLVACGKGGETTPDSSEAGKPTSSKVASSKHEHTYADTWEKNETQHWHPATCEHTTNKSGTAAHTYGEETVIKAPTCTTAGQGKKSCTVCGYESTFDIPATGHTYGPEAPVDAKTDSTQATFKSTCTSCNQEIYSWSALEYNKMSGESKSSDYLKLKSNGDLVQYQIKAPKKGAAVFYFYGFIDYWKDGTNNNDQRGFFSGKNGDTEKGNFTLTIDGTDVDISAKKGITYEQMGLKGETADLSVWVDVGEFTVANDYINIQYARVDSFNMHLLKMGIMYK